MYRDAVKKIKEEFLNTDGSINADRKKGQDKLEYIDHLDDLREATEFECSRPLWENYMKLTPQQQLAVTMLISGKTVNETCEEIGITRMTMSRWYLIPAFTETYERWQQKIFRETSERMRKLRIKALDELEKMLEDRAKIPPRDYLKLIELIIK